MRWEDFEREWDRDEETAALRRVLARLPAHDAGAERTTRIREQCLAVLGRNRRTRPVLAGVLGWGWLEPAAALGACGIYLAAAAQVSLGLLLAVK